MHLKKHKNYLVTGGEGCYLHTDKYPPLLDLTSMSFTASMGYNHPKVNQVLHDTVGAISLQSSYSSDIKNTHASMIIDRCAIDGGKVDYCLHGSVAVEGAVKMAQEHTGKSKIVVLYDSFHGKTSFSYQISHMSGYSSPDVIPVSLSDMDSVMSALSDSEVAAFIFEPIQGNGGGAVQSSKALKYVQEICNNLGIIFIADEIQTGSGRCGYTFFHTEYMGISPDIIVFGKALGAGQPVFGTVSKPHLSLSRSKHSFTTTYLPSSLAVSSMFMEWLTPEVMLNIREKGEYLKSKLPNVIGNGFMLTMEMGTPEKASRMVDSLLDKNIITTTSKSKGIGTAVKIKPPYIITDNQISNVIETIKSEF